MSGPVVPSGESVSRCPTCVTVAWPAMGKQRHPEYRKYIRYRNAARGDRATAKGTSAENLVNFGLVCVRVLRYASE